MEMGHLFEAGMLVCFGFSWPLNVIKAYKARTAKGTSLAFIFLIITGYVSGIAAKFINHQINYVLAVYFLNLAIVMTNVFVYFRNVTLDKKSQGIITKKKLFQLQQKYKNSMSYTYSQEENMNYQELNSIAKENGIVLMGGTMDKSIPVTELAQSFEFDFCLYNRSDDELSLKNSIQFYKNQIAPLNPEAVIIHLGESDEKLFNSASQDFDRLYLDLISSIKKDRPDIRIAVVSINNPDNNDQIRNINAHIKAIADSTKCIYINLENAKLWNPKATKASNDFAYSMGLKTKKPLINVAQIIYSYAYLEIEQENELEQESIAG